MEKEQEYKIGANAYEFVKKHRSNLSHAKQAELQAMLKDFAIEQVKNSVVLSDVSSLLKAEREATKEEIREWLRDEDFEGLAERL